MCANFGATTTELSVSAGVGKSTAGRLYGIGEGSFAEFCRARADKLAPKPKNLNFEQAAAAPVSALTALQAVRNGGQVRSGQSVLIIGASGGVGTFAVQIAKAFGAETYRRYCTLFNGEPMGPS